MSEPAILAVVEAAWTAAMAVKLPGFHWVFTQSSVLKSARTLYVTGDFRQPSTGRESHVVTTIHIPDWDRVSHATDAERFGYLEAQLMVGYEDVIDQLGGPEAAHAVTMPILSLIGTDPIDLPVTLVGFRTIPEED